MKLYIVTDEAIALKEKKSTLTMMTGTTSPIAPRLSAGEPRRSPNLEWNE
jgi:hypothetical protein